MFKPNLRLVFVPSSKNALFKLVFNLLGKLSRQFFSVLLDISLQRLLILCLCQSMDTVLKHVSKSNHTFRLLFSLRLVHRL